MNHLEPEHIERHRFRFEGNIMSHRFVMTVAGPVLLFAGFFALTAYSQTNDSPPAKQQGANPTTDDTQPPAKKGKKAKSDDPPPDQKTDDTKSDDPPSGVGQKGGNGKTDDPPPDQKTDDTKTDDPPALPNSDPGPTDVSPSNATPPQSTDPSKIKWTGPPQKQDVSLPPPSPTGVEVLTRGPVHEAFAEPAGSQSIANPVIPMAPPPPVAEQVPDQKPQGQNSVWIPGYWSFDDERKSYVWVSGIWRVPPPGRVWMPGHWQQVPGGSQWVTGYWSIPNQDQVDYLPTPPPVVNAGATSPAPFPGQVYAPGCWIHQGNRYLWRPGFWHAHSPGWIWIPATYVWTPAGYIFVAGYWDHPLQLRGLLFAPVAFDSALLRHPSFRYTPTFVVSTDVLCGAMFARRSCSHYCFGDYFGTRYAAAGYIPWIDYRGNAGVPDPLFGYYGVQAGLGKGNGGWGESMHRFYAGRAKGSIALPPRTLALQTQAVSNLVNKKTTSGTNLVAPKKASSVTVVTHLSQATSNSSTGSALKLERVSSTHLAAEQKTATQYRDFAQHRREAEAHLIASAATSSAYIGSKSSNPGHPTTNSPEQTMVVARSIKLQLPHEIVKASTATSTTAGQVGSTARTRPPQPTIPKPQPHGDASKPATK
jgi:WXXGXW repeat (2 copies)